MKVNKMLKQLILAMTLSVTGANVIAANSIVEMKTSLGVIEIELFDEEAPITVENFSTYIKDDFYTNTIFHRVIPGFMIQGGGMTSDLTEKATRSFIRNESYNNLLNTRGTVAMARMNDANSASSQFFINLDNNTFLNKTERNAGYAVFGKVVKGMDVVDAIAKVPTTNKQFHQDVPIKTVEIKNMTIKKTTN